MTNYGSFQTKVVKWRLSPHSPSSRTVLMRGECTTQTRLSRFGKVFPSSTFLLRRYLPLIFDSEGRAIPGTLLTPLACHLITSIVAVLKPCLRCFSLCCKHHPESVLSPYRHSSVPFLRRRASRPRRLPCLLMPNLRIFDLRPYVIDSFEVYRRTIF